MVQKRSGLRWEGPLNPGIGGCSELLFSRRQSKTQAQKEKRIGVSKESLNLVKYVLKGTKSPYIVKNRPAYVDGRHTSVERKPKGELCN